jgi:hypothetical protein
MIIESQQQAECSDCRRRRRIYAAQPLWVYRYDPPANTLEYRPMCRECWEALSAYMDRDTQQGDVDGG